MRNTKEAVLILLIVTAAPPANARPAHGTHSLRGHAIHAGAGTFAGDGHHADDASTKAAAEQEDRLLDNKLKSICRGC